MSKTASVYLRDEVNAWFATRKEGFNKSEFINDAVIEKVLRDTGVEIYSEGKKKSKFDGLTKMRASDGSHYYV